MFDLYLKANQHHLYATGYPSACSDKNPFYICYFPDINGGVTAFGFLQVHGAQNHTP
jgi:hypothetical protein